MDVKDIVSIALSALALIVTIIIFYVQRPENIKPETIIISVIIIIFSIIGLFLIYIWSELRGLTKSITENKMAIKDINKSLNFNRLYNKMDVRLKVIEKLLNKKGQAGIDPRILYWILLIILLLLLLKSVGLF